MSTRRERVVVINLRTEMVSTLAIASASRVGIPVTLINCGPSEFGRRYFERLGENLPFELVEAPVRTHGETLDWLFSTFSTDRMLLLDSDAEIRDPAVVEEMRRHMERPEVFCSGWLTYGQWLTEVDGAGERLGWYPERPWLPCVMFRTEHVRSAIAAGEGFEAQVLYNEFRFSRRLSALAARRFQDSFSPPWPLIGRAPSAVRSALRRWRLDWLASLRGAHDGQRPHYVMYDTGARLYEWARSAGMAFALVEPALVHEVAHYTGVTRKALGSTTHLPANDVDQQVQLRLEAYGLTWHDLAQEAVEGLD